MMQLVRRFIDWVKTADQVGIDREAGLVHQRLQLYQTILAELKDRQPTLNTAAGSR